MSTWMDLESIVLRGVTQKDKSRRIECVWKLEKLDSQRQSVQRSLLVGVGDGR